MSAHIRNEKPVYWVMLAIQSYLWCNARCLAEGVDVKAIDSVFLDQKVRS